MFDLIIRGGTVLDGSGAEGFLSDVAILDGKIAAVGTGLTGAAAYIDATGLMVCPGFIDSHSHVDYSVLQDRDQADAMEQGITFSVAGQCGGSMAPSNAHPAYADYMQALEQAPLGLNLGLLVGHGSIRIRVAGRVNRPVTDRELEEMAGILEACMQAGAMGMSLGLTYPPGSYADLKELCYLARVVAKHGGIIDAHIRNESDRLLESVEEFIAVLESSGCVGVISHLKAADKANWGKVRDVLAMVEAAAARGVEVYADAYPYCASSTSLQARFVPRQFHPEGISDPSKLLSDPQICADIKAWATEKWGTDLSWVLVITCPGHPEFTGKTVNEIADLMGLADPYEAAFSLIRECGKNARACFTMMCEEDVRYVLAHPRVMVGTDADMGGMPGQNHPRRRGTFPRVLGKYVREEKITSLPEMIRKMTSLPARIYRLEGKGLIAPGMDGDICIFDPDEIRDTASYVNWHGDNKGIAYVLVNGKVTVQNGTYTGTNAGKIWRRR